MKQLRYLVPSVIAVAMLAACGGGTTIPGSGAPSGAPNTKGNFTSVVMFGDSLSDGGAYAPAVRLPAGAGALAGYYFGGKFTNNGLSATLLGNPSKVWVEQLAAVMGLALTPATVGFGATKVPCPAAAVPSLASSCTNYAQGGSRVTDPNGIGKSSGALTEPLKVQIDTHLARKGGTFQARDLIFVFGGSNDVFTQAAYVSAKVQQAAASGLTGDALNKAKFDAQLEAQHAIKIAAQELGAYVKSEILAKGGKYVAVMNLPNSGMTPGGKAGGAESQFLLGGLVDNFNLWLREELTGQPVLWIDFNASFTDVVANPGKFGLTNTSGMACDPVKLSALTGVPASQGGGGSLFCNTTPGVPAPPAGFNALTAGANVSTWLFADSVHPTTGGHTVIANEVKKQLTAAGWL